MLRRFARPIFGLVIVAIVVATLDPAAIGAYLRDADGRIVVLAVAGLMLVHLIPAAGWRATVAAMTGTRLPWPSTVRLFYAAQAIGGITPANLGGDVHRVIALRDAGHDWSVTVAPIVVQRATTYIALSILGMLGIAGLAAMQASTVPTAVILAAVVLSVAIGVAAWIVIAPPASLGGIQGRLIRFIGRTDEEPEPIRAFAPALVIGFATGLLFHLIAIGLTLALVLAVDPAVPILPVVSALAVARLTLAIPLAPSGLGLQEGAIAVLFTGIGVAPEIGLAAMLIARLGLLLTTVVGVALLVSPGRWGLADRPDPRHVA